MPSRLIAILAALLVAPLTLFASTDGVYSLNRKSSKLWDGTAANRLVAATPDYDYAYGDEATVTYSLPWNFTFYGQAYGQISVDTNGNVWFGTGTPVSGVTPVISGWNDDLSSYFSGGVFIQHKTDPERVVVEWRTETYGDEGYDLPNAFEVVLFQSGDIRVDYDSFSSTASDDYGSGIFAGDASPFLSLSATYAPVYRLAGNSYGFTTSFSTLTLAFTGTGAGTVASDPAGIACNLNCSATFPTGEPVTLSQSPDRYSDFAGWSGASCSGLGGCSLTLTADSTVGAAFTRDTGHQVYVPGLAQPYFSSIQEAYDAAGDGATIRLWGTTYYESLACNRGIAVTLQGGYDREYTTPLNTPATLTGTLNVGGGELTLDGIGTGGP